MTTPEEIIAHYEKEIGIIEAEIVKYRAYFMEDGSIDTEEQKKLTEMQAVIDIIKVKLKALRDDKINIDYDALYIRLRGLTSMKYLLERWFLDNHIKEGYEELKLVDTKYEELFVVNKIVTADAELFIEHYDNGTLQKVMVDKYGSHDEAKDLRKFFSDNGGASYVSFLKENAEACIKRYGLFAEMQELCEIAEAGTTNYNNVISPNRAAMLTTDAEITTVKEWKKTLVEFITKHKALTDNVVKSFFTPNHDNFVNIVAEIPNKIKLLEEAKVKALKKDAYAKKLKAMSEEDRIKSNPDIGTETGYYKEKGKEPKPGKPNKVDSKNQNVLKSQGAYDKETGKYDMYDQGEGDVDEVDINDVKQGALGDCYLISAIAGVAKDNPSYIKKLITYKEDETFATVKLYIRKSNGTRTAQTTKVDFYFPVSGVKAAFAKAGDGELWVMVIEKAYAKLMGGYDSIGRGGDPGEALAVLTGNEAVVKEMSDDDKSLGTDLEGAVVAGKTSVAGTKVNTEIPSGYTVTAINPDRTDGYEVALSGGNKIFCSHAYTVTGVDKTANKVKLRNPHGGSDANLEITFKEFRDCFNNFKVVDVPVEK